MGISLNKYEFAKINKNREMSDSGISLFVYKIVGIYSPADNKLNICSFLL